MNKLKLYLDTCCYNRPFDNQTDDQIHLESEAIISLIKLFEKKQIEIIGSEVIDFEISKIPDIIKCQKVMEISTLVKKKLIIDEKIEDRAIILEKMGFKAFEALHVALAEINKLDFLITTDKKLVTLSKKYLGKMLICIKNPLNFIKEFYYGN